MGQILTPGYVYFDGVKFIIGPAVIVGPPGGAPSKGGQNFKIDHDHETGKIRGLLCNKCNMALGLFQESSDNVRNALLYLLKDQPIENVISIVK